MMMTRVFGIVTAALALLTITVSAAPTQGASIECRIGRAKVIGNLGNTQGDVLQLLHGPPITPENAVHLKETARVLSDTSAEIVKIGVTTITGVPANPEGREKVVNGFLLAQKSLNQVDPSFDEIKSLVQDAKTSLSGALDGAKTVIDHC